MKRTKLRNLPELLKAFRDIALRPSVDEDKRIFAVGLIYLLNELVPPDRTTKRALHKMRGEP